MRAFDANIRRVAGTDYPAGYDAPETTQNQADAYGGGDGDIIGRDPGAGHRDFAEPGHTRVSLQNSPHNGGWFPHDQLQIGPYRESVIGLEAADGDTIALNPDQASIYEIVMDGSMTVELDPPSMPPGPYNPTAILGPYSASIVVFLHRQAGGLVTWPSTIYWNAAVDQDAVYLAPTAARTDVFLLIYMPGAGTPYWAGFNPGLGLTPAANLTSSSGATQASSSGSGS